MATRQGRYCRGDDTPIKAAKGYENLFAALFCQSAKIMGITDRRDDLTDDYIIDMLYSTGSIAYEKTTGVWLPLYSQGTPTAYGRAKKYRLYSLYNGESMVVNREDVFIFDANAQAFPIKEFIRMRAATLAAFDAAIAQNLDGVKDMAVIVAHSKELARELQRLDKQRRQGKSWGIINAALMERENGGLAKLETLSTGMEYKIDKLTADRRAYYEETLHLVGVQTPQEKGERMITGEVEMQGAETSAYIELMIKTFNQNAEEQGAPFRMVAYNALKPAKNEQKDEDEQEDDGGQNNEE